MTTTFRWQQHSIVKGNSLKAITFTRASNSTTTSLLTSLHSLNNRYKEVHLSENKELLIGKNYYIEGDKFPLD